MCRFYNKTNAPCTIWFRADSWDPGHGKKPKAKNKKFNNIQVSPGGHTEGDGLGGMAGWLIVGTGSVTQNATSFGSRKSWHIPGEYGQATIEDHHGYFCLVEIAPTWTDLRVYSHDNRPVGIAKQLVHGPCTIKLSLFWGYTIKGP